MEEKVRRYSIGSLFAGVGGFELGLEKSIPGAYTLWQAEQNTFCQKVLAKHWPQARIYDDVRNITKNNVQQVDILCGGFPCQDISVAGKKEGLNGEKSGLYWEMHRIIEELQPRAVIMENVAAITIRGLGTVLGSLSEIGYDAEWCTIQASDFGAPHKRARWFCIAYPRTIGFYLDNERMLSSNPISNSKQQSSYTCSMEQRQRTMHTLCEGLWNNQGAGYWARFPTESPVCRRDDGIPNRMDRCRALGNAIVPQCSEWIGRKLWESGILQAGEYNG